MIRVKPHPVSALADTKLSQICHFGLSYDDTLGMRMFSSIGNAPGTCPNR